MEFPSSDNAPSRRRSDVDMLLFKNGLLLPMESGHLIDRYILDNAASAFDWLTDARLAAMRLKNQGKWPDEWNATLGEHIEEARNRTVPVCRSCNVAMTHVQSELTTVFYGMLNPRWFMDNRVPVGEIKAPKSRTTRSMAKVMEAVFVFFTLVPQRASISSRQAPGDGRPAWEPRFLDELQLKKASLEKLGGQKLTGLWVKDFNGMTGVVVKSKGPGGALGIITDTRNKRFTVQWGEDGRAGATESIEWPQMHARVSFPSRAEVDDDGDADDVEGAPPEAPVAGVADVAAAGADSDADSSGSDESRPSSPILGQTAVRWGALARSAAAQSAQGRRNAEVYDWQLKGRLTLWRDFSILKTVSHLMQWGAHKQLRQRALAVFWSAHYLWLTCLTAEQQHLMPVRVWYIFIFREFYMHLFPGNTWFSHDSLTMEQLTNVNISTQRDDGPNEGTMRWFRWVKDQLLAFQQDIMRLSAYVFNDASSLEGYPSLARKLLRKDGVSRVLDGLRSAVNGSEALFQRIHAARSVDGLTEYFRWYRFTLGNSSRTRETIAAFSSELKTALQKGRSG